MAIIFQFDAGDELTGVQLRTKNQQVQKVVEKGYTQVHADNAPLTVQNPMAYRKSMRITNQNGQTIFAYIEEDEEASRKICFCQQYSDGTFSRTLTISQADVVTIIMAGGGSDILYEHDESETSKKLEKV